MTTIDAVQAGFGRWIIARAERRARVRERVGGVAWMRVAKAVMQLAGLGWLDLAAWTLGRTVGYIAIGLTFILVSAMITPDGAGKGAERR